MKPRTLVISLAALLGVGAALVLSVSLPMAFGYRSLAVRSGSMEPWVSTGDVLVNRSVSPLIVNRGDVVTFADPMDEGRLITHRVQSVRVRGLNVDFVTRGDANHDVERWSMPGDQEVGRAVLRLPWFGHLLSFIQGPVGQLGLVVGPSIALGLIVLIRIWGPGERSGAPS